MIPTPDLSHLGPGDYKDVYEPAEDTFILLDALEQDAEELKAAGIRLALEIGPGSGCVSAFLGQILGASNCNYISTDINFRACRCTVQTGSQNKVHLDSINTSLVDGLRTRLRHSVDLLVFNPPYVPTKPEEASAAQALKDGTIQGSWAGGLDGMEITNELLDLVDGLLSPIGRFYLVALKQNNILAIQKRASEGSDLESKVVLQRRAGREHLFILRFQRKSTE